MKQDSCDIIDADIFRGCSYLLLDAVLCMTKTNLVEIFASTSRFSYFWILFNPEIISLDIVGSDIINSIGKIVMLLLYEKGK